MELTYSIIGFIFGVVCVYDYLCNEFESPVTRMSTTIGIAFICIFPLVFFLWPLLVLIWTLNILRK